MSDYSPIYIYFGLALAVTLLTLSISVLFPSKTDAPAKFLPYESGIQHPSDLLHRHFPMRHYLVALTFLIFDVEVIFLSPWAVVAKSIGPFAFYEMLFFLVMLLVGFAYVWRKGGLEWE